MRSRRGVGRATSADECSSFVAGLDVVEPVRHAHQPHVMPACLGQAAAPAASSSSARRRRGSRRSSAPAPSRRSGRPAATAGASMKRSPCSAVGVEQLGPATVRPCSRKHGRAPTITAQALEFRRARRCGAGTARAARGCPSRISRCSGGRAASTRAVVSVSSPMRRRSPRARRRRRAARARAPAVRPACAAGRRR